MPFYAYMIQSETSGKHYYGHTSDLEKRIISHNSTQNKYTRRKGPWELIGYVECESHSDALKIESKLKKMKNPSRAKNWLLKNGVVR